MARCSARSATTAKRGSGGESCIRTPSTVWYEGMLRRLGLSRGYSAHSMRVTFITTALEHGAPLEDVQKAAGHRDASTTKLYDRRGYNPEKAASFLRPTDHPVTVLEQIRPIDLYNKETET